MSEKTLSTWKRTNLNFETVNISSMFDFKYKESIEKCNSLLEINKKSLEDNSEIKIKNHDYLIDLSPCIGVYQEAIYFNGYDINKAIESYLRDKPKLTFKYTKKVRDSSLDKKILFLVSLDMGQDRYIKQVKTPFVDKKENKEIKSRLSTFLKNDEKVQVPCEIDFSDENGQLLFSAHGLADVVKDNIVYELKFVYELSHEHFLQCACYMIALGLDVGLLWNTRKNEMYEIHILDRKSFMDNVVNAITKGLLTMYIEPSF